MIELGMRQKLFIDHTTDFGVYLCEEEQLGTRDADCILLPRKQVPVGAKKGDGVEVFVYKDSKDRPIATVNLPKVTLGEVAVLDVLEVTKIGAFLGWGLEKDLLLPYGEQTVRVKKGEKYLVGLYIDKSDRLCATMKVYDFLRTDSNYEEGDFVQGTVFGENADYGIFVAVDNRYNAMIPKNEMVRKLNIGDEIQARVVGRREDGKLNLSLREKGYIQMDIDAEDILRKLEKNGGFLPYHDKSSPEEIRREFGMSKNEFKRAIGRLYKARKIIITDRGIQSI
ncbi:MAG: S1-like domain-containing RNA-binding protein [Clostridiales bacterium]|nr:S1-like domain-containing RNA-binding protein [Clostridiales bacterium]